MTIFEINNKARALGMSYGQYVMRFGPFDAEPEEFERRCAQCGRVIPTKRICASNTQYCSETCRTRSIWDEVKRKERERKGKDRMEEPKFNIGRVGYTTLVTKGMERNKDLGLYIEQCMTRHQRGDWGDISEQDKKYNAEALLNGGKLLSYYVGTNYCRDIIIVTDTDRLHTTVMYPQEW